MKQKFIVLLTFFNVFVFFGQTDPEDIIVVYDSLNPNGKVILKSNLSSNLDSLSPHLVDDMRKELFIKKDSATISKLLVGKWKIKSVKRINGDSTNLIVQDSLVFGADHYYSQSSDGKTVEGKWILKTNMIGNVTIQYNEKQYPVLDENIIKALPKDYLESLSYDSNILSITELNEEYLILTTFLLENAHDFDTMFYRLVLKTYARAD
ncbi:hypothetical protein [Winogradskyella tangerina]|uniref:hypothetical protein n=1 Tax=Winogradskyella tangerina TaxID=2023240 RepID=UPI0013003A6C|nr:hypothetical protein [Winogradskyella tangerina]